MAIKITQVPRCSDHKWACIVCGGFGYRPQMRHRAFGLPSVEVIRCWPCNGTGWRIPESIVKRMKEKSRRG